MRGCQNVLTWGVRPHARESGRKSTHYFCKKGTEFSRRIYGPLDIVLDHWQHSRVQATQVSRIKCLIFVNRIC